MKNKTAKQELEHFTKCYIIIAISLRYNFISLYPNCGKLCLLGCRILLLPIKFSKISNLWTIHLYRNLHCVSFHYLVFALKTFLTVVYYLFYCCVLFIFKERGHLTLLYDNCDYANLLTIDKFSTFCRIIL